MHDMLVLIRSVFLWGFLLLFFLFFFSEFKLFYDYLNWANTEKLYRDLDFIISYRVHLPCYSRFRISLHTVFVFKYFIQ